MSREQKLALLIGFALVLVVGVVVSDHFSTAMQAELEPAAEEETPSNVSAALPEAGRRALEPNLESQLAGRQPIEQVSPSNEDPPAASAGDALNETIAGARSAMHRFGERLGEGLRSAPPAAQSESIPVIEMGRVDEKPPYDGPMATHVVSAGESLWSIAERRYGDGRLHEAIAAFNKDVVGPSNELRVGATLRVPPKDVLLGERAIARDEQDRIQSSQEAGTRTESSAARTYTVRAGDTLGEIAQRELGSARRWRDIARLNDLEDPDRVPVGTVLTLPR